MHHTCKYSTLPPWFCTSISTPHCTHRHAENWRCIQHSSTKASPCVSYGRMQFPAKLTWLIGSLGKPRPQQPAKSCDAGAPFCEGPMQHEAAEALKSLSLWSISMYFSKNFKSLKMFKVHQGGNSWPLRGPSWDAPFERRQEGIKVPPGCASVGCHGAYASWPPLETRHICWILMTPPLDHPAYDGLAMVESLNNSAGQ